MGADEANIQASLCAAIRIEKEQKSVSREKRAEATYAEYRRQKASGSGSFDCVSWIRFCDRSTCSEPPCQR
jgi:hypothetical protein